MRRAAAALAVAMVLAAACRADAPTYEEHSLGGAVVVAHWDGDRDQPAIRVLFEPSLDGYHMYALDFDPATTQGIGVPTRIDVEGGWAVTGSITADRPVEMLEYPSLGVELPVYPPGVVTFTIPVAPAASATAADATVRLTFALCSANRCLKTQRDVRLLVDGRPPEA